MNDTNWRLFRWISQNDIKHTDSIQDRYSIKNDKTVEKILSNYFTDTDMKTQNQSYNRISTKTRINVTSVSFDRIVRTKELMGISSSEWITHKSMNISDQYSVWLFFSNHHHPCLLIIEWPMMWTLKRIEQYLIPIRLPLE